MLLALGLALAWPAAEAGALSVEWQNLSGRERVIIRLDAADGRIGSVARNSSVSIILPFSSGSKAFAMSAPGTAKLFGGVESAPGGLSLKLKSAGFGYIVSRPAQNVLHVDIFSDPTGLRWRPESARSAPAAPVAKPAPTPAAPAAKTKAPVASAKSVPPAEPTLPAEPPQEPPVQPDPAAPLAAQPQPLPTVPAIQPEQPVEKLEPSSVFSQKINPPAEKASMAPAGPIEPDPASKPAEFAPSPASLPEAGRISAPLDDEDSYKLPEWPPIKMPPSLPAPPAPPPSGPGACLWPFAPQSAGIGGSGGALNVFDASGKKFSTRRFAWRDLLPFASAAYAASTSGQEERQVVEAPFAYRGKLNVNADPNWVEQPIPVLINVPVGTVINSGEAGAPEPAFALPPPPGDVPGAGGANVPSTFPVDRPPMPVTPAQPAVPVQPAAPEQSITAAQPTAVSQPEVPAQAEPVQQAAPSQPATPVQPAAAPQPEAPAQPAPASAAQPGAAAAPQQASPDPAPSGAAPAATVMYVDEQGNPVEPPLEPEPTLRDVDRKIYDGSLTEAIAVLNKLLGQQNLSRDQREIALHRRADAIFSLHEHDLAANYQAVIDSTNAAINFNTRSSRNAAAYLRLGYTNLMAGNSYEAAGYFNLLRREFPHYENLPLTYYYWGDYQYSQGNLNEAVEQFNYIVNNFPEHPISRDAALGLSRSYYRMGYFDQAYKIMLFVEQRWPTFYLDYPPMLSMMGDVAYRVGNLDKARSAYWLYYNLAPNADDADMILTRLGDIYASGKFHSAAVQVYSEAVKRFPAKDGGIISLMRLAEDGVYDNPSLNDMIRVFERPYDQRPAEAYRTIIRDYPDSPLVTLAKLKLAMWMLWQRDYITVLDLTSEIVSEAPNSPLADRAREVAMSAFTLLAAGDAGDKRYSRAREVWDRYPILQAQAEFLDPESRLALAVSQWNTGANTEALATLEPFFYGAKAGEVSEMALFLALNIMTEHYQWDKIEDLARRVELWELTPQARNQMNYALALAYENMDKAEAAAPLWAAIHTDKLLPPTQLANAAFYLARSKERQRDFESAYYVGQDALQRLIEVTQNDPDHADMEKIKTQILSLLDIAESSGVLQQALDYAQQYLQYVGEGSSDQQSVMYRMARLHKKRGDTAEWLRILEELANKYPDSVFGKTAKSELASYRLGSDAARFSNTQP